MLSSRTYTSLDPNFDPAALLLMLLVLTSIAVLLYVLLTYNRRWSRRGGCRNSRRSDRDVGEGAGVSCPVLFTDGQEFRGNRRCFGIGRFEDVDLSQGDPFAFSFSSDGNGGGVRSFEVRPGYLLRAYPEPHFSGEPLVRERRGPYKFRAYGERDTMTPPRSLVVSLTAGR